MKGLLRGVAVVFCWLALIGGYVAIVEGAFPRVLATVDVGTARAMAERTMRDFGDTTALVDFGTASDPSAATWYGAVSPAVPAEQLPIYFWKAGSADRSVEVEVGSDGRIIGVVCTRCGRDTAAEFVKRQGLPALESGAWSGAGQAESASLVSEVERDGALLVRTLTLGPGQFFRYQERIKRPPEVDADLGRSMFFGELVGSTGFVAYFVLVVLAIGRLVRHGIPQGWGARSLLTALILGFVVVLFQVNSLTSQYLSPPSGVTPDMFRVSFVVAGLFAALVLVVTLASCLPAGASLAPAQRPRLGPTWGGLSVGYLAGAAWLVVSALGYSVAREQGWVTLRLSPPDAFALVSFVPLLMPLAGAAIASFQEETLFRWFGLGYVRQVTGRFPAAVLLTGVTWAVIHANYPVYPYYARIIELIPLGIVLGAIMWRWGFLSALTAHFIIDAMSMGLPIARAGGWLQTLGLVAVLAVPALGVAILRRRSSDPRPAERVTSEGHPAWVRPAAADDLVVLSHLTKDYGTLRAVDDVSLDVRKGRIVCLLGPNGAGKSTLLRMVVGEIRPTSGTVVLRGADATGGIGYVPDTSLTYPLLTVVEHLRFVEQAYDLPRLSPAAEAEFLERFGLREHADFLSSKLSKGLKRRLLIACAVRHDASLLVLDEPFDGLDPEGQRMLTGVLAEFCQEGGGVLVSTHRLDIAKRLSDRIVALRSGRVAFAGSTCEFAALAEASEAGLGGTTDFEAAYAAVTSDGQEGPR